MQEVFGGPGEFAANMGSEKGVLRFEEDPRLWKMKGMQPSSRDSGYP